MVVTPVELGVAYKVEEGIFEKAQGFIDESCEFNCGGFLCEVGD